MHVVQLISLFVFPDYKLPEVLRIAYFHLNLNQNQVEAALRQFKYIFLDK